MLTIQNAIRLLRTEQPGDSELLELAKHMGADALERQAFYYMVPRCEKCGRYIHGLEVRTLSYDAEKDRIFVVTDIDPACCPGCGTPFSHVEVDYGELTCILKAEKEFPPRRAHINRAKRKYRRVQNHAT